MIKTSSYNNFKSDIFRTVSISGDRGKNAGYKGECYSKLAPKLSFWKKWHEKYPSTTGRPMRPRPILRFDAASLELLCW